MTVQSIIRRYGDSIALPDGMAKGFVFPLHHKDGEIHREPLPVGVKNGESFLLISDIAVSEGTTLCHAGERFEVRHLHRGEAV